MICENCESEIKKGNHYYETEDFILCENCIDDYLADLQDDWQRYLPTNEEMEAENIRGNRF